MSGELAARQRDDLAGARLCASRGSIRTCPFGGPEDSSVADRRCSTRSRPASAQLGALVADYHHAAVTVAEAPDDSGRLAALGAASAPARGDGRLAARAESRARRLPARAAGRPADERAVGRLAPPHAARPRRWSRSRTCCCSTSRPTISTSTRSAGSRITSRDYAGAVLFVTHDRAFLSALATRIVELDRGRLTSWPGIYPSYLEKKAAALDDEARDLERLDKKLAQEEAWLRQGVKARRTRNEGRVRDADEAARRARRASRAGRQPCAWRSMRRTRRGSWCSRPRTSASRSAARRSSATTRSGSCAAIASA